VRLAVTDLPELADRAGRHVAKRSLALRGAVVGAVLYGGFSLELELSTLIDRRGHHSLLGVVAGTLFGLVVGAAMGFLYGSILRWFRPPKIGAHVLAGLAAATALIAPLVLIIRQVFGTEALLLGVVGAAVFGIVLGVMVRIYVYNKDRNSAA
jgi:hypothetical protein